MERGGPWRMREMEKDMGKAGHSRGRVLGEQRQRGYFTFIKEKIQKMYVNLKKAGLLFAPSSPKEINPIPKSTDRKQKSLPKVSGGHCKGITRHSSRQDILSESS